MILASTVPACDTTDFSFDSATAGTLMSRRVVVPFPAGCTSQTLLVRALEDVDGLDETLTLSLEEGDSYAVTLIPDGAVRDLTVTDNEPVVMLRPLGDPFVAVRGVVTELNFIAVDVLLPGYVVGTTPVTVNVAVSGDIDEEDVRGQLSDIPLTALSTLVIDGSTNLGGAPGQRESFFTIADDIEEDEEAAIVTLLAGNGYRLPLTDSSRSVTILDSLRATIPDTTVRTAIEGGAPATVTVQLSRRARPSLSEFANLFFTAQPAVGSYTVSGLAQNSRRGEQYVVQVPFGNDNVDSIVVTITATEDDNTVDEVLMLTLVELDVINSLSLEGSFFFPNPAPTVTIILEDNDAGAVLAGTLTEENLDGSTVTVTLLNTEYVGTPSTADFTLTSENVPGTLTVSAVSLDSTLQATLTLAYSGEDIVADGTLSVTVPASGHIGTEPLTTNEVAITASDTAPVFGMGATIGGLIYILRTDTGAVTLPQASGGNGTLTYTITPALPPDLIFDMENRQITGISTEVQNTTTYIYMVSDSDANVSPSDSSTLSFTITTIVLPPGNIAGSFVGEVTERGTLNPEQTNTATGTVRVVNGFRRQDGTIDRAGGLGTYGTFVLGPSDPGGACYVDLYVEQREHFPPTCWPRAPRVPRCSRWCPLRMVS